MSHSNIKPSSEPRDRFSWLSLPGRENSGGLTQHEYIVPNDTVDHGSRPASRTLERHERSDTPPLTAHDHETFSASRYDPAFDPSSNALNSSGDDRSLSGPRTRNLDDIEQSKLHIEDRRAPTKWLPYTLRRPYLITLSLASLVLSIVLAALCWQSYKHKGLGDDNGSTGPFIGWRYTPTIVAVLFTQAVVQVAEDIKRTEPYARLASPKPTKANFTLFYLPEAWWKSIFVGFSRKRSGGHRRWNLALSSLAAGISILGISTFSSSVFVAKEVLIRDNVQLQRYAAGQATGNDLSHIQLLPRRDTYFRTISGYLFNVSTSMWLSGSHFIVPFGASDGDLNSVSLENGMWQADTEVFHLDYNCTPMVLLEKTMLNITYRYTDILNTECKNDTCTVQSKGFKVRSQDGCEVQVQGPIAVWDNSGERTSLGFINDIISKEGGLIWTNMSSTYVSWQTLVQEYGQIPDISPAGEKVLGQWPRTSIHSFSDQCLGRDLLLVSPQWIVRPSPAEIPEDLWEENSWNNLTIRAEVCTPMYKAASLPVTASLDGAGTSVFFDASEFERRSQPVSKEPIDLDLLDDLTFRNDDWDKYMAVPSVVQGSFEGISMLLASSFAQNISNMLENATLGEEAGRLRTRFTRELLLSSITETDVPWLEAATGGATRVSRRILVVTECGLTLSVLFFILACYLSAMVLCVSTRRRPLNLRSDPATIAGTASLLGVASRPTATFEKLVGHKQQHVQEMIGSRVYHLQGSTLSEKIPTSGASTDGKSDTLARIRRSSPSTPKFESSIKDDWRPSMLHKRWLVALLAGLVAIATTMLVLRKYARENKLHRTAFTYQVDLGLFSTTFSPHSVIATLIAVGIGLSWDGIDKPMRILQPYLSMSRKPVVSARGASLTYQSSYWVWAAVKAALHKHWILCMVAIGTTLSQVLIISMAAVFERQAVLNIQETWDPFDTQLYMTSPFELRQEPLTWSHTNSRTRDFGMNSELLESSKIEWLYNALDEIVLEAPQLAWTKDEWVFTPLNMERLPNVTLSSKRDSEPRIGSNSDALVSPANVSFVTSAIRSRLQCSPITLPGSDWLEQVADVFPDRINETLEGFALPTVLFEDQSYNTSVLSVPRRLSCCANGTGPGQQAVVAYWSSNSSLIEPKDPESGTLICTSVEFEYGNCTTDSLPSDPVSEDGPANVIVHGSWHRNFTIKWIVGLGATAKISGANLSSDASVTQVNPLFGSADEELLYFTDEPNMAIMDCVAVIENTTASVTVARSSGNVLDYSLLADPQPAQEAWKYAWDIMYPDPTSYTMKGNVSYGHLFMTQLLTAPHIITPKLPHSWLSYNRSIEETASERFNVRDRDRGLNVDFMSYANWHLANKNTEALLNTTTLLQHSEKTLQTFFKHFVHTGTWGSGRDRAAYESVNSPDYVNGTFTQRIDVLTMNETATWISLAILILLIVILVVLIVGLQVVYPSSCMQHHVECLADVLTMVAGSDALISLIEEQGVEGFAKSSRMTRLAWFKDRRGDVRWGVELVDAEGVEWIDGPGEAESDGDEVEESLLWSGQVVDAGGLGRFLHNLVLRRRK